MFSFLKKLFTKQKSSSQSSSSTNDNRFYYLSLIKEKGLWSIHGLWPQIGTTAYPTFCRKVTYDHNLLQPILATLREYWHSNRGSDDTFWKHEWEKHGSCMYTEMTELEYFQKTLTLFEWCVNENCIWDYATGSKAMIPFDLDFKLMKGPLPK